MRPQKYIHVADRFAKRIRKGDYHVRDLPAERELALEMGVSCVTARKAVQRLIDQGLLCRQANGRLAIGLHEKGRSRGSPAQIALLTPAWESPPIVGWRNILAQASTRLHASCRVVPYTHWDDPVITATVKRFDGTFLIPEPEPLPEGLIPTLRRIGRPLVVLDADWSEHGIRSVRMDPPTLVQRVLDHLAKLGHRKIDCFNVQPGADQRILQWRLWLEAHRLDGELVDEPVQPYTNPLPAAYAAISSRLRAGAFHSKALYCTTQPAAAGAMGALLDHGLRPGHDVAVCTSDGGAESAYSNPPLTGVAEVDRPSYLAICLEWMLKTEGKAWHGPLLLQPDDIRVIVRQSTVPTARTREA